MKILVFKDNLKLEAVFWFGKMNFKKMQLLLV